MPDSIRELCTRIASGDPEAFSRFYSEWFDWMYAAARRATGRDESFCLDVVQESMLRVIKSLPKTIEGEPSLRTWLARVVRSCALDALRGEQRRRTREWRASRAEEAGPSRADFEERIIWLRARIAAENADTAALIRLRHAFGWTLARLGRAFNLSTGAVDGRINRAIESMRDNAKETFDEP